MHQKHQPTPASLRDSELVARAQRGEEEAFGALFHAHNQRVYRLCLRMTRNVADAEELTQEAFLTLFRKIHTFRGESAFSTWLLRITVNIVLMRLRRKTPKEMLSLDDDSESDRSEQLQNELGSPDAGLEGIPDRIQLEMALAELPQGYRQVFELHDVLGHEHHEIAEILGYSVGNSKSQLFKARMRLRKLLGPSLRPRRRKDPRATTGGASDAVLTEP